MIVLVGSFMVALKPISVPFSLVSFRVMRASTLVSSSVVFESIFRMASLKVNVILSVTGTWPSKSVGSKTIVGETESTAVKVIELALIALSYKSSTDAAMAT